MIKKKLRNEELAGEVLGLCNKLAPRLDKRQIISKRAAPCL